MKWKSKQQTGGGGADGGGWEEMGGSDGVKGEEVLLAGLAAFGWPLVFGCGILGVEPHSPHTATGGLERSTG